MRWELGMIEDDAKHIWFSSDLHCGHPRMIKYCNRPFKTVEEMDETILSNINDRIDKHDTFYILGDFASPRAKIDAYKRYRDLINCRNVVLVLGNHDLHRKNYLPDKRLETVFTKVYQATVVRLNPYYVYLQHYACRVWPQSHYGSYHLFAHCHNNLKGNLGHGGPPNAGDYFDRHSLSMDVGVDCHNFCPINLNDVIEVMKKKEWIDPLAGKKRWRKENE